MEVAVTEEHLEKGKPKNPQSCGVALALGEHFGKPVLVQKSNVIIGLLEWKGDTAWTDLSRDLEFYTIGLRLKDYIAQFDDRKEACDPVVLNIANGVIELTSK